MNSETPRLVGAALERARTSGFEYSCDPAVGRLLATLAAAVPENGRVLELGTGVGVGTAWLVSGLLPRTDATVTSVESDPGRGAAAASGDWPGFVDLRVGDGIDLLAAEGGYDLVAAEGGYDLVFADCVAGKHVGLDRTIAALRPRGVLVVDDMVPAPGVTWDEGFAVRQEGVRRTLLSHERLVALELAHGSGVILATAR
ncbi:SAM-dependent methyltransferase [Nonomuraea sp. NN258]|uniref:O-methyltransferase n=1 Tax=Nonomuraea antri TaxID=2730852 RepID=UPI001569EC5A|nr:class I SAM-dependent methyltransferase [Nonomuraea antri]NRQ37430.1 SAM-dependent methyltransferase [Nonomuraea antri]